MFDRGLITDLSEQQKNDIQSISKNILKHMEVLREPILKVSEGFQNSIQNLRVILDSTGRFSDRTKKALLLLGKYGWYLDFEMTPPMLFTLEEQLSKGKIDEAEADLVNYFDNRISDIEGSVTARFPSRSHIIRSAFAAHRSEEYNLSIPVLFAQVDGICKECMGQYLFIAKNKKPSTSIYVDSIATDIFTAALLSPFANTLPINASEKQRPEEFKGLNRHMVLHGESTDYGSRINSLKAISLIGFVASSLEEDKP